MMTRWKCCPSEAGPTVIFDPTDEYTPFGHIRGGCKELCLLVTPDGGDLVRLPDLFRHERDHSHRQDDP